MTTPPFTIEAKRALIVTVTRRNPLQGEGSTGKVPGVPELRTTATRTKSLKSGDRVDSVIKVQRIQIPECPAETLSLREAFRVLTQGGNEVLDDAALSSLVGGRIRFDREPIA